MTDLNEPPGKWIEALTRLAGWLGFNATRVRWKLMGLREKWRLTKGRGRDAALHVGYRHRLCPHCGTLQERSGRNCVQCGRAMAPRFIEVLGRLGIRAPTFFSVTSFLTLCILLCYLRTATAKGGLQLMSLDAGTLIAFGGNFPPAFRAGEWWRLATYIFLHAGLWHILFNLIALQQIGPSIEQVFGRGRTLFFFMVTGVLAGLGSELMGLRGVGIGASGSLMGLIGLAAGWGQRDGTTTGRNIRDMMVKWGVYTVIFGFMIGADNAAHVSGFWGGAILGYFSKPQWERRGGAAWDTALGLLGLAAALATVGLVLFPPGLAG